MAVVSCTTPNDAPDRDAASGDDGADTTPDADAVDSSSVAFDGSADAPAQPQGGPDDAAPPLDTAAPVDAADAPADLPPIVRPEAGADSAPDAPAVLLATGAACKLAGDCKSNNCIDGVCCGTACAGRCQSCAQVNTGQPDGTCAPSRTGVDPHDDCAESGGACGQDGSCDGAGKCRLHGTDTICQAETCAADMYTPARRCDGQGTCAAATPVSCQGFPCEGSRCKMTCASDGDCASGNYCKSGNCVAKKATGTSCGTAAECLSGTCADGVCCGGPCNVKCYACAQASTGFANGTCAPVVVGTDPHNDCAAQSPGSCGSDGTCDGKGGCRNYPSGTVCNAESCTDGAGSSTYVPGSQCDGSGSGCVGKSGQTCPNHLKCGGNQCKSSCSGSGDCTSGYYCAGSTCAPKKNEGDPCASGAECTGGTCGGRCCSGGCLCPQPSAVNRLTNPSFDTDQSGWTVIFSTDTHLYIEDQCQYSHQLFTHGEAYGGASIQQCVSISQAGTYNFGVMVKMVSPYIGMSGNNDMVSCTATPFTDGACSSGQGTIVGSNEVDNLPDWNQLMGSLTVGSSIKSIRFRCDFITDLGTSAGTDCYWDHAFVSPAPNNY